MYIVEAEKWDLLAFQSVVPMGLLEGIKRGESFPVLAVEEDDQIAGVMIYSCVKGVLRIEWIYIAEKFRRRHYAIELLAYAQEQLSRKWRFYKMEAVCPPQMPRELEKLFESYGFWIGQEELTTYEFRLSQVEIPQNMIDKLAPLKGIPLKETTSEQKRELAKLLQQKEAPLYFPISWEQYDAEYSMVRYQHGVPEGILLVRKDAEALEIAYMLALDATGISCMVLLVELWKKAMAEKKPDKDIRITATALEKVAEKIIKKMAPGAARIKSKTAKLIIVDIEAWEDEEMVPYREQVIEALNGMLQENEVETELIPGSEETGRTIRCGFMIEDTIPMVTDIFFYDREDSQVVNFYAYMRDDNSREEQEKIAEVVEECNNFSPIGHMGFYDGELFFRYGLMLKAQESSQDAAEHCLETLQLFWGVLEGCVKRVVEVLTQEA